MTTIPQSYDAVQDQLLDAVKQSQSTLVEAVRAWADVAEKVVPAVPTPALPSLGIDLPRPEEVVAKQLDFAEKLLASQRELLRELVAAVPQPAAKQ